VERKLRQNTGIGKKLLVLRQNKLLELQPFCPNPRKYGNKFFVVQTGEKPKLFASCTVEKIDYSK
jgi:hypothetical protein